ncbi:MAG: gluzincin family metallopeptidase [Anaerolineae bacterium]
MLPSSRRAAALLAVLALVALLAGVWWLLAGRQTPETAARPTRGTGVPALTTPGLQATPAPIPTHTPRPTADPTPELGALLSTAEMPPRDDLAVFEALHDAQGEVPRVVYETPPSVALGEAARFWLSDSAASGVSEITATLHYQNARVHMWVEEGVEVDLEALARSADTFAERIYPINHATFGEEWIPGVDGDTRLAVLNARFSGASGYFARANEYARAIHPYSNEREMFVMNVGVLSPGTDRYDATLAHEFQHMIHWHQDDNEDAWVNEGLSVLAEHVNGYDYPLEPASLFIKLPNLQLNTWSPDTGGSSHYGASFLFLRYLMQRLGSEGVHELVQEPQNGIAGIEAVLSARGTGITFPDLFADWLVANVLNDATLADGRYGYTDLPIQAAIAETIDHYPYLGSGDVQQYAGVYLDLLPEQAGTLRIQFQGEPTTRLVPNQPAGGAYQWWSNRGDSSHASLQHAFDLREAAAPQLTFDLWYDIEDGWDYAYLRVSEDGGTSWELLRGAHMSGENPYGNALGWGYTGLSGGDKAAWVRETVDLSAYAGKEILLRFDYVTDETINQAGLCLDNLTIDAVGFADDVEAGEGAWQAEGFIRHDNHLAQGYLVQLVTLGAETKVERLPVAEDGAGTWLIEGFGLEIERGILIVSAMAPSTTESAHYKLRLEQLP